MKVSYRRKKRMNMVNGKLFRDSKLSESFNDAKYSIDRMFIIVRPPFST
jgi:hypothetical protein